MEKTSMSKIERIISAVKEVYNNLHHSDAKELPAKSFEKYNFDALSYIMPLDSLTEYLTHIADGNTLICPDDGQPYVPNEKMRKAAQNALGKIIDRFECERRNGCSA